MQEQSKVKNYTSAFISLTFLFFMWGFMTVLNDILIPYLKEAFELYSKVMLVQFGGAVLPVIMGAVADAFGVRFSLVVPLASYLYLAFYGANGYKRYKSL